jgi:Raf kinase inhibitor-like YbhB/YbcL family protein
LRRLSVSLELRSNAFEAGGALPDTYTCEGEGISPPFDWINVPPETKAFVLICDDPDAPRGTFSHWVLYNIPADHRQLAEGIPNTARVGWGGTHGRNERGDVGYAAPCPPVGSTHRYYFRLCALDADLQLPPGETRQQVLDRIEGHVLGRSERPGG